MLSLGHAHPEIVKAVQEQSEKIWHNYNLFQIPGQEKLAANTRKGYAFHTHFSVIAEQRQMRRLLSSHVNIHGKTILLPSNNHSMAVHLVQ